MTTTQVYEIYIRATPDAIWHHTYRFLFSDVMKDEGFTRVTWEIEQVAPDFCSLTVIHDVSGAPMMASMVSSRFSETGTGGWSWILSDIKSLLETGSTM